MKRLLSLSIFISALSVSAISQTDKGWKSVGGTGMLRLDFKNHSNSFALEPETYWFAANSFALGSDFGIGFNSSQTGSDSTLHKSSSIFAYIAPGFRFYFRDPAQHPWRPYIFANGGFETLTGHDKLGNNPATNFSSNGFRGYAGIGEAWFFSDHAAFDMRLHLIDFSYGNAVFAPTIYIGIQAHFHKE